MRKLFLPALLSLVALAVFVPATGAANGDMTCNGTAPPTAHDLIVLAGDTCTIMGTSVGHDVIVQQGATLNDNGGQIGHDIRADRPSGIALHGLESPGTVGHDVNVNGVSGSSSEDQYNEVCDTDIGHDLNITNSTGTAASWFVGDFDAGTITGEESGCFDGAVQVTHDLSATNNANSVDISENGTNISANNNGGIGHDLNAINNNPSIVEGNIVGHDANCSGTTTKDSDPAANTAGHKNTCG
jgi:hypothetical protein